MLPALIGISGHEVGAEEEAAIRFHSVFQEY